MVDIIKIADRAAEQLSRYPVITGKEKLKRLIKGSILRQKLAPTDAFSWHNGLLAEGLLTAFEAAGEKKYLLAVAAHLKRWKSTGFRFYYVDNAMNGWTALWITELLTEKDAAQSAVYKSGTAFSLEEKQEILTLCKEAAKACADWLKTAPETADGILCYRSQHPDWIFADTLGMVCPFLCRYGAVYQDEDLLRLGVSQLQQFVRKGMDAKSGLPYHGYDEKTGMKYGVIGWGRACGWMLKGLGQSLPWIPKTDAAYEELLKAYRDLAAAVIQYQRPDGGFSWQLSAMEGHRDSSAEGMIGTALAAGIRTGLLDEKRISDVQSREPEDGFGAVLQQLTAATAQSVKADGTVTDCSGECAGFAEYPQVYGTYPWGTGAVLSCLARQKA